MSNSKQFILTAVLSTIFGVMASLVIVGAFISLALINPKPVVDWITKHSSVVTQEQTATTEANSITSSEELIVDTVQRVKPAVVSVIISQDVPVYEQYYGQNQSPFGGLFRQNGTEKQEVGGGSGFIVSTDGYIITNKHVVSFTDASYTVFTNDGKKYDAKVVARDPSNDIAVLKIEANNLPYLTFGNSDQLEVGQTAIAIGNPLLQFNNSVSVGIISGLGRSIVAGDVTSGQTEQLENVIQTDAAINPGNSGGPLLNSKGEVIGVNVAVAEGQGAQNIGFALPSNLVKKVVDSVETTGTITRPYLGVRYIPVTTDLQTQNTLPVDYGALIVKGQQLTDLAVIPGSPADKAGIVENDIILEADGKKLDENNSLSAYISQKNVGDTVILRILHDGQQKDVTVTLEANPNNGA